MSGSRRDARRRDILVAAAGVLAVREAAGMAEVATAAGIARGTLYRYFPTRESLLQALEAAANEEAGRRLAEANLDEVPVEEALARATRALVAVGEHFIVLLRERRPPEPGFSAPLVALLDRGREDGHIRSDVRPAPGGRPRSTRLAVVSQYTAPCTSSAAAESVTIASRARAIVSGWVRRSR